MEEMNGQVPTKQYDGPFGADKVPVRQVPGPKQPVQAVDAVDAEVPFTDAAVANLPGWQQGAAARTAELYRPESTALEGFGAAVSQWDTTRLVRRLTRPSFEDDTPLNLNEALQQLPMVLSEDELEYVQEMATGTKAFEYAVQQVQDRRMAARVVGDHPIAGLVGAFVDPLYLAVPPAVRLGKAAPMVQRGVAAGSAAAISGGIVAAGEGPVSDTEIALGMALNAGMAAAFVRNGKVVRDPEFPEQVLQQAATPSTKPRYKLVDGKPELLPPELQPGAVPAEPAKVVAAVDTAIAQDSKSRGLGEALMWNTHKTLSSFGEVGKRVADLLLDNNADLSKVSVESHREAILTDLRRSGQIQYEQALRDAMASQGFGTWKMLNPLTSREAHAAQRRIERELQVELYRREQSARLGTEIEAKVAPHIAKMADHLDAMHKRALAEMKAAGVEGAENLLERPGYLNRKWSSTAIDGVMDKLEKLGMNRDAAKLRVQSLVSLAVRRGNPRMTKDLADDVSQAIVQRALDRGHFEDTAFNAPSNAGTLANMREMLTAEGVPAARIDRILDVLKVSSDEAGKAGYMKHRLDLDYRASMRVGDELVSVIDLIDGRVSTTVDQYIQRVSTNVALARNGVKKQSDLDAMRREFLNDIKDEGQRGKAAELFDNIIAHYRGEPNGAKMNENFRLMQSYTRAIALAYGSLWQLTEYATAMGEYGLRKTLKYAMQELPGFKQIMSDKSSATSLQNVLADHSATSMRLRPYLSRYEDGYEMDTGSALQLAAQPMGQLVPYANGMKFVHHHQARVVGNLILDRINMAANGNKQAREALAKYGLEAPVMDKLAKDIKAKGFDVDSWDRETWAQVRPAVTKMMDEAVLRGRLGDVPAFAAFDPVGKFIFTYRTFVLAAHNKVLAGGLARNGAGAVGLMLMYQLPLAMAAVQAQAFIKGEGQLDADKLVKKAMGQMGGIGLFSEPLKWATGESNAVGAPGLIAADRGVKLFQGTLNGDPQQASSAALTMLPVIAANPFIQGVAKQIKE